MTSDQAPRSQPPDPLPRRVPGSSQMVPGKLMPGKRPAVPRPRPSDGPAAGPEARPPGQQATGPGARPPDTQTAPSGVRRPDGQAIKPDARPPDEQNGQGVKPRDGLAVTPDIRRPGEQDAGRLAGSPDTQTARPQPPPPAAPAGRGDAHPGRRPDDPATGPVVPWTGTEVERAATGAVAPRASATGVTPSWPRVVGTTVWLWAARRRTWWRVLAALVVVLVVFAAGGLTVALLRNTGSGSAARGGNAASGAPGLAQVQAAATARQQAAAWVTAQVSHSAMVSCDPVMCATLEARGFPSGDLLTLGPAASDPLGSAVIVSTAAVRSEIGSRLTSVYAPTVIASFGSGSARIDVRVYAAGGAATYLAALRADQTVRQHLGSVLLHNSRVSATPAARAQLAAGLVDTRLLAIIATLSAQGPVSIVAFGDAGPGASAGMPLRAVELASPPGVKAGYLSSVLALLHAQQAPYLANSTALARLADGRQIAQIEFAAPSPLGLLSG
jgi:hypothetical protein